jgi:hypothetical protein
MPAPSGDTVSLDPRAGHPRLLGRRIGTPVVRAAAALVVAFGAVALFTDFLALGAAPKAAGVVFAGWLAIAVYRANSDKPETLPRVGEIVVVVAIAAGVGFGVAWWTVREREPAVFDFVAVPHQPAVFVSLAPQPKTEVESAGLLVYGARLGVLCNVEGSGGRTWFRLESGYFVSARDIAPAPLSDAADPPAC